MTSNSSAVFFTERHLRDGLCQGAIAPTNDNPTQNLVTPKFFNARIGEVSREFLGLRHLGAVVWQNKLQLHDALRTGDQDEKKAAPKSIVTPKDPPKVNIPNCELCAVWRALIPAILR